MAIVYDNRYEGYQPLVFSSPDYQADSFAALLSKKANNYMVLEPNSQCLALIDSYAKSNKTDDQILSILSMIGVGYNLAFNNLVYYRMFGTYIDVKNVQAFFDMVYDGRI